MLSQRKCICYKPMKIFGIIGSRATEVKYAMKYMHFMDKITKHTNTDSINHWLVVIVYINCQHDISRKLSDTTLRNCIE